MKKIIVLLALVISFCLEAQTSPCITDAVLQNAINNDPSIKEQIDLMNKSISDSKIYSRSNTIPPSGSITIPVVVYIIHNGEQIGVGANISDTQVNAQLSALNYKFLNTGVKFCLATRVGTNSTTIPTNSTSEVQTTPGIIHINNTTLTNHISYTNQQALINTAHSYITGDKYLRIWVVSSIDGQMGPLAYAWFPNGSYVFDGIVIRNNVFGSASYGTTNLLPNYTDGETLVHEVGHYLGLYHTFEEGCTVTTGDQNYDGDRVYDTPKVRTANFNCISGTDSCPDVPIDYDLIKNYMDYGTNVCADSFTTGQIIRMNDIFTFYRSNLISQDNILYTGTCGSNSLLSATITPEKYTTCASTTTGITFTSLSNPGSPWTYLWNFGDNTTSITPNPYHIYTSAANSPYTVTLTVTNISTGEVKFSTVKIYVTNCSPIINSYSNWYLSRSNSLKFNTGLPVFDLSFPVNKITDKTCAVQNDNLGNLLFYTNKINIWNKLHTQINSTQLTTNQERVTNSSLIVPNPLNSNEYINFTSNVCISTCVDLGLKYNTINVTNGIASMGLMNQPVTFPSGQGYAVSSNGALYGGEGLTAIKSCNGYWIITILKKANQSSYLVVYSLTDSPTTGGLNYVSEFQIPLGINNYQKAYLKASPNGNKLVLFDVNSGNQNSHTFILDFNKSTGIISDSKEINFEFMGGADFGGVTFSPDSKFLYFSKNSNTGNKILQYDLNSSNINSTKIEVAISDKNEYFGNMQLGPDNKVYIAKTNAFSNSKELAVIHNPNNRASINNLNACQYSKNGPKINSGPRTISYALPNMIDAKPETTFPTLTTDKISSYLVGCNKYKFFPNVCGTTFNWTFANTTTGVSTLESGTNPVFDFTISGEGAYTITLTDGANNFLASTNLNISFPIVPTIVGSSEACTTGSNVSNNSVSLLAGQTVTWEITGGVGAITGSSNTMPSVNISWTTLPGQITANFTDEYGCTASIIKNISIYCYGVGANDIVFTTKIQPTDNKIIMGGNFTSYNGTPINRIARLKTDMTLDTTFIVGTGADSSVKSSAIQTDGKILIVGAFSTYNGVARKGIARLNTNGSLDTTFAVGTGIADTTPIINAVAIQSDGKILIGGIFTSYNGTTRINIARLNTNGTIDTTFNSSFTTSTGNDINCIAIQTDGKIIIGGSFTSYGTTSSSNIARLNINGTIDSTFNIGTGITTTWGFTRLNCLKLQLDNKILIGGYFGLYNGFSRFHLARLNSNGTLDTGFIPESIGVLSGDSGVNSIDLQSDNKIFIGGGFKTTTGRQRIARLNVNGSLDITFDPGLGFGPASGNRSFGSAVNSVSIQTDGKIVTGGRFTTYNNIGVNNITRLNPSITGAIGRFADNSDEELNLIISQIHYQIIL